MTRQTQDGTTTYNWALVNNGNGNYGNTTTVIDPGRNKKVYTFTGLTSTGNAAPPTMQALTEVQTYQNTGTVSNPVYTLLTTGMVPIPAFQPRAETGSRPSQQWCAGVARSNSSVILLTCWAEDSL
jgi:hypothetical protein